MKTEPVEEWIRAVRLDLGEFDHMYERKELARCLYHLQQATEKTFKATALAIVLSSEDKTKQLTNKLGIPIPKPEDYGHLFRKNFLRQIEQILKNPLVRDFVKSSK